MAATARVFRSGNSQAVRLPKEFRFPEGIKDLTVTREGARVILEPVAPDSFSPGFWKVLGSLPAFERPKQIRQRKRRSLG